VLGWFDVSDVGFVAADKSLAISLAGRHDWQATSRRTTKMPLSLQNPQESRLGRKVQCSERVGALEGSGLQMTGGSLEK